VILEKEITKKMKIVKLEYLKVKHGGILVFIGTENNDRKSKH